MHTDKKKSRSKIDQKSLAELFAPVHQAVRDRGISDEDLDSLLQVAVADSRQERQKKNATTA